MKIDSKNLIAFAVVETVLILSFVALFFWSRHETRPLAWDQAIHTRIAYTYQDRLSNRSDEPLFAPVDMNYPPLFHLSLMTAMRVVSNPVFAGPAVNAVWLVVLLFSVYGIGRKLMGAWEGAAAAAMLMCYPLVIDMLRDTMIDFSLMGAVALAVLCLVMSESFSRPAWSVLFGVALAGALLTKWTAAGYIAGPFLYIAWDAWGRRRTRWMWGALGLAALLLAPWYVPNLLPMLSRIPRLSKLPPASGQRLDGLANVLWYPLSLFEQMTFVFVALLAAGAVVSVRRKELRPVLAWFAVSMLLFSLIRNRNTRYFLPALPAAALLSVAWFRTAPVALRGVAVGSAIVVTAFAQFGLGRDLGFQIGSEHISLYSPRRGAPENWRHEAIIGYLNSTPPGVAGRPARVLVVANAPFFHSTSLSMSAREMGAVHALFYGPSKRRSFEFADYVLTKTGDLGPQFTLGTINACVKTIKDPNSWFPGVYKEVMRWPLADGTDAVLYAAKPDPQDIGDVGFFNLNLKRLDLPHIEAEGVRMRAKPLGTRETREGRLKEFVIQCDTVRYKKIPFENVTIRLVRPQINLPYYLETQSIELLSLDTLHVRAAFHRDALLALAADKARWLKNPHLSFEGNRIFISGQAGVVPLKIEAVVDAAETELKTRVDRVAIAGVPIPRVFLRSSTDHTVDLNANRDLAYNVRLAPISGKDDTLWIGR